MVTDIIFDTILIGLLVFVFIGFSIVIFIILRDKNNESNTNNYQYRTKKIRWWPIDERCKCEYCKSDGELDGRKISDNEYLDIWTCHNVCMAALYGE